MWAAFSGIRYVRIADRIEYHELPLERFSIMAHDIRGFVIAAELEIAVVGRKPAIDDLDDLQALFSQHQPPGRLLAPITAVALYPQTHARYPELFPNSLEDTL
jgi:hypothetical protein